MKRYSQGFFQGGPAMFEQPDGKYVKYEDAAALREALGRLHAWALAQEGDCMFSGDHPIAQAAAALGETVCSACGDTGDIRDLTGQYLGGCDLCVPGERNE